MTAEERGIYAASTRLVALPSDLEQAAVEQVAHWFQNREKLGLVRIWPHQGTYEAFTQLDLLLDVKAVLKKYQRWDHISRWQRPEVAFTKPCSKRDRGSSSPR